ncbi:inner membrane-spanning protein YciB [Candidatus Phycosocius spiralis]|uniref:Inner membrane-spanning protein YciB n=1 Tax=Candidatus Phycosocius spiralis TaxID=2815099 RepID=A0ABQ4PTR8_9PROT|nr:septation protein IspZ [Candidatus Phycosocius spiralis]GIU66320.1 putative intracellular septation protein A [Candidatus Phycosocius spiralis]
MPSQDTPSKTTPPPQAGASWVRLLSDLGPALVFFVAYSQAEKHGVPAFAKAISGDQAVLFATTFFIPAAVAGFVFSYWKERKISSMGLFTFVMITIFSGLALWLKNDIFIKMRPTLVYSLIGLALLGSVLLKRNLVKALFSGALHMPDVQWHGLAQRAGLMYLSLAMINEAVWRTQPLVVWVTYNTWGDMAINMAFWIINMIFLAKYFTDADGKPLMDETRDKA